MTASDYEAHKEALPAVFHNLPLLLVTNNNMVTAGLRIYSEGSKLILDAKVRPSFGKDEPAYIKRICVDQNHIEVTFENNKHFDVDIRNNQIKIKGQVFTKSSDAQFASVLQKIEKGKHNVSSTNGMM